MKQYIPKHLQLWKWPQNYLGKSWPDFYVFLVQNRDSEALERSNFKCALALLGGESDTVIVVGASHWAVGWVEWIGIHKDAAAELELADEIAGRLEDYPVVDEVQFSEEETQEANEVWRHCYSISERIAYIRQRRDQFEFHAFRDMLACVRGDYFCGYASELLS